MKHKVVSGIMLTLLLLATAIGVTASPWDGVPDDSTPAQAIWVDPKNTTDLDIGNTFVVDVLINITDPPGAGTGLWGFQYKLKWNSTVLEAVEIETHTDKIPSNDLLSGWTAVYIVENETGVTPEGLDYHSYAVSATAGTAFTGVDSLCTYMFKILWQPEPELGRDFCVLLDLYDDIPVDDTATPVDHTTVDGRYCVPGIWLVHNINTGLNYVVIQEAVNAPQTLNGHTIQVDAWTYYEHVVVNKSISLIGQNRINTIVDGSGTGNVIEIRANNVVVRYFTLRDAGNHGVLLDRVNNCIVRNNDIMINDGDGVHLNESSDNTISGNTIANNGDGISLDGSSDNTVSGNTIANNDVRGVGLWNSSDNTVSGNTITDNDFGVQLEESSNNTVSGNTVAECDSFGIVLYTSSSNNTVSGNTVTNSSVGIWLDETSNNSLTGNTLNDNVANFGGVSGYELSHFMHSIDVSNLVDGKSVYYLVNQTDLVIDSATHPQVGYLALINCANVTAEDLNLTDNGNGLLLAYTNNSRITGNNITNSHHGVELFMSLNNTLSGNIVKDNGDGFYLASSSNNTLSGNTMKNNAWGIQLYTSSNNSLYHNDFLDNTVQVYTEDSVNVWNDAYPSGGNYWSDHNPPDLYSGPHQNETGSDGIGDTPYFIDGNNTDRYPLIYPYGYVPTIDLNNDGVINIIDIVTVGLAFDSKPGDPNWNPIADINQDGVVNIIDVVMVGLHFDETYP